MQRPRLYVSQGLSFGFIFQALITDIFANVPKIMHFKQCNNDTTFQLFYYLKNFRDDISTTIVRDEEAIVILLKDCIRSITTVVKY